MWEQLYERRNLIVALTIVGLLSFVGGAVGLWIVSRPGFGAPPQPTPLPTIPADLELTLPPALDEFAAQYPELEAVLRDPDLGSVYKDFLVAYESGGAEAAEDLARQRGLLNDRDEIVMNLVVDSPDNRPAVVAELESYGITVTAAARDEINVAIAFAALEILAERVDATGPPEFFSQLTNIEHVVQVRLPTTSRTKGRAGQQSVVGEGIRVTAADAWHQAGYQGRGVKVAILDNGFSGYRALLGAELPPEVVAKSFEYGVEDIDSTSNVHGTACAEIVHEMAPGAELYLVHFDGTNANLYEAVEWLVEQDVDIISYSMGTSVGPRDGSGPGARMVNEVAALGILWVSAAGNEADLHYRGTYADANGNNLHEFPDGNELMSITALDDQFEVLLQWDDWEASAEDYELHLYDSAFNLLASSTDTQAGNPSDYPIEYVYYDGAVPDALYYVGIEAYQQTRPALFDLFAAIAPVGFPTPEHSLSSPADAIGALAVGAAEWSDDSLAYYSSQGPTDDGRLKPEISAPTDVASASYAPDSFGGTSAAAPHVAGAAALLWSAQPELSREQMIEMLQANALDLGPPGPDVGYGFGRLEMPPAVAVAQAPAEGPTPIPAPAPTPSSGLAPAPSFPTVAPTSGPPPGRPAAPDTGTTLPAALGSIAAVCLVGLMCCGGFLFVGGSGGLLLRARRRRPVAAVAPSPFAATTSAAWVEYGGKRYDLSDADLTIGRAPNNHIVLSDAGVSRRHARIVRVGQRWFIVDLQSANGTFVNGERITRRALNAADRITIEGNTLLFG